MKQIYIKTTNKCNLHCKHCYMARYRNQDTYFDEIQTCNWINNYLQYINDKDILISLHGGEPLLCPNDKIIYTLDFFRDRNISTGITSNLIFNISDKIDILNKLYDYTFGAKVIKTSFDFGDIRFTEKTYNTWFNNVKELKKLGFVVGVNVCATKETVNTEVRYFIDKINNFNIDFINFERLTPPAKETLFPNVISFNNWFVDLYDNYNLCNFKIGNFEQLRDTIRRGIFYGCNKRTCTQDVVTINTNGTIGGCPNCSDRVIFTNIYKNAEDYFNSNVKKSQQQKEKTKKINCLACSLYKYCNGDCFQLSWSKDCWFYKKLANRIIGS